VVAIRPETVTAPSLIDRYLATHANGVPDECKRPSDDPHASPSPSLDLGKRRGGDRGSYGPGHSLLVLLPLGLVLGRVPRPRRRSRPERGSSFLMMKKSVRTIRPRRMSRANNHCPKGGVQA